MIWDQYYRSYLAAKKYRRGFANDAEPAAHLHLPHASDDEVDWLIESLEDDEKKWFVLAVVKHASSIPRKLFHPLMRAAIYEQNPSENRWFIEICLRAFGTRAVYEV